MSSYTTPPKSSVRSCLIEIDNVALDGLRALYTIAENLLAAKNIKIDQGIFLRHCMGIALETGLDRLMHSFGLRLSAELAQTVKEEYLAALVAQTDSLDALVKVVKGLVKKNVKVTLLTRVDPDKNKKLFSKISKLPEVTIVRQDTPLYIGSTTREAWGAAAAEHFELNAHICAVVSSSASCKAALASSLSVVAVPNDMTDYQDFTGAFNWCESFDPASCLPAILEALRVE